MIYDADTTRAVCPKDLRLLHLQHNHTALTHTPLHTHTRTRDTMWDECAKSRVLQHEGILKVVIKQQTLATKLSVSQPHTHTHTHMTCA